MERVRVRYWRAAFTVSVEKPSICECCGRKGRLECHHWKYAYKTSEVRKNPQLALENTSWLCFTCHRIADAYRKTREAGIAIMSKLVRLRIGSLYPNGQAVARQAPAVRERTKKRGGLAPP